MAELRFKLSPTKKIPFKLIGDLTTIGRDPNNSIVIDHPSVSPFHAEILLVHSEDRYEVFDLGSPQGTKVNEEQVIRKELQDGDEIKFGKSEKSLDLDYKLETKIKKSEIELIQDEISVLTAKVKKNYDAEISKKIKKLKRKLRRLESN